MKFIFTGILVVVLACVYFIRQSGYNPKPILVMKASQYSSYSDLGVSLLKRFYLEAKSIQHFVVYCDFKACEQQQIWQSFLSQSNKNSMPARKYYSFNYYKNLLDASGQVSQASINQLTKELSSKERSLIILPLQYKRYLKYNNAQVVDFLLTHFYINSEQENSELVCSDSADLTQLNCLRLGYSRRFYRKNFSPKNKHVGMEKLSHNKYIIYLNDELAINEHTD